MRGPVFRKMNYVCSVPISLFSMKKIIIIILLFCSVKTNAQSGKDSLVTKIAREVCSEMSKKDFTGMSESEVQMELGLAFMPYFQEHADEISNYYPGEPDTSLRRLGMDVGFKMAVVCPDAFSRMFKSTLAAQKKSPVVVTKATEEIKGTLEKIVDGEFTYFIIKNAKGKSEKIWWMEYFSGSEKITNASLNELLSVEYYEKEVYNPALKEYIKIKIAAGVY